MRPELRPELRPETEAELSEALRSAGPLVIRGGGTRGFGRAAGAVLQTGGLAGVQLYEPGALTLVVRAGTGLAEVDAVLAGERQRLAFEVPDYRALLARQGQSTIGGVVAANASGPRRVQVGGARDALLGVRFVDGAGTIIKNGGRVMKNVTGYDLVKLVAGSHGVLGVLSEVSLKVQAVPEAEASLLLSVEESAVAVGVMSRALGSPYDVSGAGHIAIGARRQTLLRVEGMAGSVRYRIGALQDMFGGEVIDASESAHLWREIRDVLPFAAEPGAVWRVGVKPTTAASIAGSGPAVYDWGGGLLWLLLPDTVAAGQALRDRVGALGGHATMMRGQAEVAAFQPERAAVAALSAGLRAKFDPRGIFNQGMTS
jgi:glycolate oxidase FAD binding subunit